MQLLTKYFGTIDYAPGDVIAFPNGVFGFEGEKEFLLLPFHGSQGNLLCLQSVRGPAPAFVALNPFSLKPDYAPVLSEEELYLLQAVDSRELCYFVLCAVRDPVKDSTVNLTCPIVVNPDRNLAAQVILETEEYHMRHPLSEFPRKGAETSC